MASLHTVAADRVVAGVAGAVTIWVSTEVCYGLVRHAPGSLEAIVSHLGDRLSLVPAARENLERDRKASYDPDLVRTASRTLTALGGSLDDRPLVARAVQSAAQTAVVYGVRSWTDISHPGIRAEAVEQAVGVQYANPTAEAHRAAALVTADASKRLRTEAAEQVAAIQFAPSAAVIAIGQRGRLVGALNSDAAKPRVFGAHHVLALLCRDGLLDRDVTQAAIRLMHFEATPEHLRLPYFNGQRAMSDDTTRAMKAFIQGKSGRIEF